MLRRSARLKAARRLLQGTLRQVIHVAHVLEQTTIVSVRIAWEDLPELWMAARRARRVISTDG